MKITKSILVAIAGVAFAAASVSCCNKSSVAEPTLPNPSFEPVGTYSGK